MIRLAQVFCAIFVLFLGVSGLASIFSPETIFAEVGFEAVSNYGVTNLRTLGAPTLALAIVTALGAYRKDWWLILPASLYFLLNFSARLISVFAEGFEPIMARGMILTIVLFTLSQVAIYMFRTAE
ncbi:MAG: hypothetical protein AAGD96_11480 [Chloroflexota bacterium]